MSMPGRVVLDTSIVIAHFRNETSVTDKLQQISVLVLPSIALGELYTGALRKETNLEKAVRIVADFAGLAQILCPNATTARVYGQLRAVLLKKGTPIPDNDLWIAAIAVQYHLPLANRDGHFDRIDELVQAKW